MLNVTSLLAEAISDENIKSLINARSNMSPEERDEMEPPRNLTLNDSFCYHFLCAWQDRPLFVFIGTFVVLFMLSDLAVKFIFFIVHLVH